MLNSLDHADLIAAAVVIAMTLFALWFDRADLLAAAVVIAMISFALWIFKKFLDR